jgi:hypothetical protein
VVFQVFEYSKHYGGPYFGWASGHTLWMIAELEKGDRPRPFRMWLGVGRIKITKMEKPAFWLQLPWSYASPSMQFYVRRTLCEVIWPSFFACTLNFGEAAELFTNLMSSASNLAGVASGIDSSFTAPDQVLSIFLKLDFINPRSSASYRIFLTSFTPTSTGSSANKTNHGLVLGRLDPAAESSHCTAF